jgi:NitT/TauT family transport system substrate-binding protein
MNTRLLTKRSTLAGLLLGLMLAGCNRTGRDKPGTAVVRLAMLNVPVMYLPVILADEMGYFREEGLSVTIESFSSTTKIMQSLLSRSADVVASPYEVVVQMAAEGRNVKAFMLLNRYSSRVLVVLPGRASSIRRIEDLRNAKIGVAALGAVNHQFLNYVLAKHGLSPTDVQLVVIGTTASAVAALRHEQLDAAVLSGSEPAMASRQLPGLKILVDARGAAAARSLYGVDVYPSGVLASREDWLHDHPDAARKTARAVLRAVAWIQVHSPEEVLAAVPERYRAPDRSADMETLISMMQGYSRDGVIPADGAEAARQTMAVSLEKVRTTPIDVSRTYTNEFVLPRPAR